MDINNFAVFIPTYKRSANVKTLDILRNYGYTGAIYLVVGDDDPELEDYKSIDDIAGVKVFSKSEIASKVDTYDLYSSSEKPSVIYARVAIVDMVSELGLDYFCVLDDDYNAFRFMFNSSMSFQHTHIMDLDRAFTSLLEFMSTANADCVAMAQGGDFIGGSNSYYGSGHMLLRKVMNSFFCRADRPLIFQGRMNDDVNTYCLNGSRGLRLFTFNGFALNQGATQQNSGGLTQMYLEAGTYTKSFYTVMACPSFVKVSVIGVSSKRLHHRISWNNAVPKIVSEDLKKR